MSKLKVWGAFWLLSLVWGSSFLFIKIAVEDLTPLTLVTMRVGIGAAGLLLAILLTRRKIPRDRSIILKLIFTGLTGTAIPFVLITWGEQFIDSGLAGILNGTVPLFTLAIAHFALADERITWLRLGGLALGFVGMVVIFSNDLLAATSQPTIFETPGSIQGQLAIVLAALFYGVAAVFIRHNLRNVEPLIVAGGSQVVTLIVVAIGAFLFEAPLSSQLSGRSWFAIVWLGLLGVTLAFNLYFYVIREWSATRASLVTYVMPIVAVLLGAIVLDEVLKWQAFAGGALILGGIALVNRKTRQASVAPARPLPETSA